MRRRPRAPWRRNRKRRAGTGVLLAGFLLVLAYILGPFGSGAGPSPAAPPARPASPALTATPTGLAATPTAGNSPTQDPAPSIAPTAAAADATTGSALAVAQDLPVKGRAPKTGYDRSLFGEGWKDVDHNGCDTRNDILARDLTALSIRPGTGGCVVASGTLVDPYSGRPVAFLRGQDTSVAVQIDHVVALMDAWQKGAQAWDEGTRIAFANDPLNLLAVAGELNQSKGAGDAATWLPPNKAYRCAYVARQVSVKHAYGLWVTAAERDAMVRVLSTCPGEPMP